MAVVIGLIGGSALLKGNLRQLENLTPEVRVP
jgi:hypothetical protein